MQLAVLLRNGLCLSVMFAVACVGDGAKGDGTDDDAGTGGPGGGAGISGASGDGASGDGSAGTSGAGGGGAGSGGMGGEAAAGSGGTGSMASGGLAASYFPLVTGGEIVSRHNGSQGMWDETTTIKKTTYMGMPAFELTGSADPSGDETTSVLFVDGAKTFRATKDISNAGVPQSTTEYTPGFLRFDTAWLSLKVGETVTNSHTRVLTKMGKVPVSSTSEHKYTIEALDEAVTVPAGSFKACLRVKRERVLQPGTAPMDDDIKTYWFCPGVGKVKEEAPNAASTEELVSCNLDGAACP